MARACGCEDTVYDGEGQVVRVDTCPSCLPAGAITWLIENGRQLDMWEVSSELDSSVSVRAVERNGTEARHGYISKASKGSRREDLPF